MTGHRIGLVRFEVWTYNNVLAKCHRIYGNYQMAFMHAKSVNGIVRTVQIK